MSELNVSTASPVASIPRVLPVRRRGCRPGPDGLGRAEDVGGAVALLDGDQAVVVVAVVGARPVREGLLGEVRVHAAGPVRVDAGGRALAPVARRLALRLARAEIGDDRVLEQEARVAVGE